MSIYNKHAIILLATGFDATSTVYTLDQLRAANFHVQLISLQKGLIQSKHGLWIKPDASLETADLTCPPDLVVMPDGEGCAILLLRDPRVHRLLEWVVDNQGAVAALPASESGLYRTSAMHNIPQQQFINKLPGNGDGQSMIAFVDQLVARLAV